MDLDKRILMTPQMIKIIQLSSSSLNNFTIGFSLKVDNSMSIDCLRCKVEAIVTKHEILRSCYQKNPLGIAAVIKGQLPYQDIKEYHDKNAQEVYKELSKDLVVDSAPLFRFSLLRMPEGDTCIIAVFHELLVDTASLLIIARELMLERDEISIEKDDYSTNYELIRQKVSKYKVNPFNSISQMNSKNLCLTNEYYTINRNYNIKGLEQVCGGLNISKETAILSILINTLSLSEAFSGYRVSVDTRIKPSTYAIGNFKTEFPIDRGMVGSLKDSLIFIKEYLKTKANEGRMYEALKYMSPYKEIRDAIKKIGETEIGFEFIECLSEFNILQNSPILNKMKIVCILKEDNLTLIIKSAEGFVTIKDIEYLLDNLQLKLQEFNSFSKELVGTRLYTPSDFNGLKLTMLEAKRLPQCTQDIYPLSAIQQGMLFHSMYEENSPLYHEQIYYRVSGEIVREKMQEALNYIIKRHEVLRSIVLSDGFKEPVQVVLADRRVNIEYLEDTSLKDALTLDRKKSFVLNKGSLLRVYILNNKPGLHDILMSFHHIILDGWSNAIMMVELLEVYSSLIKGIKGKLPTLENSFKDFVLYQRKLTDDSKAIDFWKNNLKDSESFCLPGDYEAVVERKYSTKSIKSSLNLEMLTKIKSVCAIQNITVSNFLMAAYSLMLKHSSGHSNITFGCVTSGRPADLLDGENIVGCFLNTLPIAIKLEDGISSLGLIHKVVEYILNTKQYDYLPLNEIVKHTGIGFDSVFVYENYPVNAYNNLALKVVDSGAEEMTNYNLTFVAYERDGLELTITYAKDIFKDETIVDLLETYTNILNCMAINIDTVLDAATVVPEKQFEIINSINNNYKDYDRESSVVEKIQQQVAIRDDETALVYEEECMSYKKLNIESNRIANLLAEKSVGVGNFVCIMMERSFDLIVAMLGVMKSGATYVPLDPKYPIDRINYILKDSGAKLIITEDEFLNNFQRDIVIVKDNWKYYSDKEIFIKIKSEDIAYMIYTSGSTGLPKGVMVKNGGVNNYTNWVKNEFSISREDCFPLISSFAFDLTVTSCIVPLISGGSIAIGSENIGQNPYELLQHIENNKVSVIKLTPSHFGQLLQVVKDKNYTLTSLRVIILGGEALNAKHVREWISLYENTVIVNEYGPTEATVATIFHKVDKYNVNEYIENIPIGKPIYNTKIHILNDGTSKVLLNVKGEICIGGENVSKGYLNQKEKTRENFIENPYGDGKLYRTGDIGRINRAGLIEYLGRIDNQVKVRGYRIELGEIESVLNETRGVREASVIVKPDKDGSNVLKGYVTLIESTENIDLKSHLKAKLPEYMIPGSITVLADMPLTINGKIDRRILENMEYALPGVNRELNTETERTMAEIWKQVLGTFAIGRDDNFFELGGHSLMAMQLYSRVRETFGIRLKLRDIYLYQSLKEYCGHIDNKKVLGQYDKNIDITIVEKRDEYDLSNAQKRLWFLYKMAPQSTHYNTPFSAIVHGNINSEMLEKSFSTIIMRHGAMRTGFLERQGVPKQFILDNLYLNIDYYDAQKEDKKIIDEVITEDMKLPFELSKPPLIRCKLFKLKEKCFKVYLNMHHIICDGWGMGVLINELLETLGNSDKNMNISIEPLEIQYVDYAAWQNKQLEENKFIDEENYWLKELSKPLPVLELPTDFARPSLQTNNGSYIQFKTSKEVMKQIKSNIRNNNISMNTIVITAYAILLRQLSNSNDIIIGTPISGRINHQLEKIIGFFVNTLPIRIKFNTCKTLKGLLQYVQEKNISALENQMYPFDRIIEKINPERSINVPAVYSTVFTMQNTPLKLATEDGSIYIEALDTEITTSKYDLNLNALEKDENITFYLEYNTDLFHRERILQFKELFLQALTLLSEPKFEHSEIQKIQLLSLKDIEALNSINSTYKDYDRETSVVEKISRQVAIRGDETALVFGKECMSYKKLNIESNKIANLLLEKSIGKGSFVAIMMERSFELIIAMVGVMKSGATYVPLDPEYPMERVNYILKDSGAKLIITQHEFVKNFVEDMVIVKDNWQNYSKEEVYVEIKGEDIAYMIYTSGSTGLPKGVMVKQIGVNNYTNWVKNEFSVTSEDSFPLISSFAFDLTVTSCIVPLISGGSIAIGKEKIGLNPYELLEHIDNSNITIIKLTPSHFGQLLQVVKERRYALTSLRVIILGGEALNAKHVREWINLYSNTIIVNEYGPTEATVATIFHKVDKYNANEYMESIPIGKPIYNTEIYILKDGTSKVPIYVKGEICIGGESVSKGYLNQEQKTGDNFIENPYGEGKLYKTGDIGRINSYGLIEYLGRIDNQVKVRGYRIELGEIESVLKETPGVRDACVIVKCDNDGINVLKGYVTLIEGTENIDLKEQLIAKLPEYMIPGGITTLVDMPLTVNGKIDRKILENMEYALPQVKTELNTETERGMAEIWKEVLGASEIGAEDNFFELGGHSLMAMQLYSRITEIYTVDIELMDIFMRPTVRELCEYIDEAAAVVEENSESKSETLENTIASSGKYPLSLAQGRLWIEYKLCESSAAYSIPIRLSVTGTFREDLMEKSLNELMLRHEVLRTYFVEEDGVAYQVVAQNYNLDFKIMENLTFEKAMEHMDTDEAVAFDLTKFPLIRVKLFKLDKGGYILYINMHHIITDGWSLKIIIKELSEVYNKYLVGDVDKHRSIPMQYGKYSVWQRNQIEEEYMLKQKEYWIKELASPLTGLNLPWDYQRINEGNFNGASFQFFIDNKITEKIKNICLRAGVTNFMFYLSSYFLLLNKVTGDKDIIVGIPLAGRNKEEIENTIGFFVNSAAIRIDFKDINSFGQLLEKVKTKVILANQNQEYPFELIAEELKRCGSMRDGSLFSTMFTFDEGFDLQNVIVDANLSVIDAEQRWSKFDLLLGGTKKNEGIVFKLEYNSSLFKSDTISGLQKKFIKLLNLL